jgi:hypothetical protein
MKWSEQQWWRGALVAAAIAAWGWPAAAGGQERVPAEPPGIDRGADSRRDEQGVETLTRGPVHEAFAAPTANDPEPTEIVRDRPPEPIDEEPPEYKAEGAIWIPGYWEWDVATTRYVWVSGMWRVPPPGMRWVPTYWTQTSGGWQRVPGFWVSGETSEVQYHPTPPESLETGPSTPSPGADYFYVPGCWVYYDTGFRWRAGYWAPYRDNYVWCPDRWYWTPRGCVFIAGFWDWRPGWRGCLFAPIVFTSDVYLRPGWRYRPWCLVDTARFYTHLWIGPRAHCYYFGNYYGPWTSRWGFTPWCDWGYGWRGFYDPIWSWCNVYYGRRGIDFIGRTRGWHRYYERNVDERPAVTFAEQSERIASGRIDRERSQNILADELRDVVQRGDAPVRLARLDDRQRESVRRVTEEIRELNQERRRLEADASVSGRARLDRSGRAVDGGRGRETASLRLPQVSEAVREAAAGVERPERPDRIGRGPSEDRTARSQPPRPDQAERPGRAERPERPELPERPQMPSAEPRLERPERPEPGRPERPEPARPERTTRPELPQPEVRGPQAAPRSEAPPPRESPRIEAQRPQLPDRPSTPAETPQVEPPRTSRIEVPRATQPRVESPRVEAPRAAPRVEAPRVEVPRSAPRVEVPRSAPRVEAPRSAPRSEAPRGSSGRGRGRDRD